MNARWKTSGLAIAAVALAAGVVIGLTVSHPTMGTAQQADPGAARYTVVHTEGTNIIVTDNKTNTCYYYTIDQGTEAGSDLKLRATVDLNQVGKQVLTPKLFKKSP